MDEVELRHPELERIDQREGGGRGDLLQAHRAEHEVAEQAAEHDARKHSGHGHH